jgi:hypothetical protein
VLFRPEHLSEYHATNWLAAHSDTAFAVGDADGDADASASAPRPKKPRKSAAGEANQAHPVASESSVWKYQWAVFARLCAMAKSASTRSTYAALHVLPVILNAYLLALASCGRPPSRAKSRECLKHATVTKPDSIRSSTLNRTLLTPFAPIALCFALLCVRTIPLIL